MRFSVGAGVPRFRVRAPLVVADRRAVTQFPAVAFRSPYLTETGPTRRRVPGRAVVVEPCIGHIGGAPRRSARSHLFREKRAMADIAIVLSMLVVPGFAVMLVVVEVMFRRSDAGRRWRKVIDLEEGLQRRVAELRSEGRTSQRRLSDAAGAYENAYIRRMLRRRPIRDLHPYLSVSMSWSALENAGIDDLEIRLLSNTWSAARFGQGQDQRELGVILREIEVRPLEWCDQP